MPPVSNMKTKAEIMKTNSLIRLFAVCMLFSTFAIYHSVSAASPVINIDQMADTLHDRIYAIVGTLQETENKGETRKVRIERIFHLPGATIGSVVDIKFMSPANNLPAGMYVLLLQEGNGSLICGAGTLILGPIENTLPVKSLNDQDVFDSFVIYDTFRIQDSGIKEKRLDQLFFEMSGRPLIIQYVLDARKNLAENSMKGYANSLLGIVYNRDPLSFGLATVLKADTMLINLPPSLTGSWVGSEDRRRLFQTLKESVPVDSPDRVYIDKVVSSFATVNK